MPARPRPKPKTIVTLDRQQKKVVKTVTIRNPASKYDNLISGSTKLKTAETAIKAANDLLKYERKMFPEEVDLAIKNGYLLRIGLALTKGYREEITLAILNKLTPEVLKIIETYGSDEKYTKLFIKKFFDKKLGKSNLKYHQR